ncbi:hypothetical protein [Saccharothrix variisporea]|uniref:Uncharacterized protein n=1 Tax=Saccharothrix variisporea TaxID=543527 RepID=A0A495XJJ0_9PSEU|nr:hypothetical protein [Saccharothrix variisporea]RKT73849.1 hypothetical protein DFJ66_7186 [Saccharothrix variisporea]
MSFPELPPRRALPADVRERMRRTVFGPTADRARGRGARGPLAVAVAVAVLVGGLVVARTTSGDGPGTIPVPPTGLTRLLAGPDKAEVVATTPEDLSRCGLTAALFTVRLDGRRVLAGRSDRFCELTHATTSTSTAAASVPVGDLRVTWRSPSGVLVGKVPPGLAGLSVRSARGGPLPSVLTDYGYFVARSSSPATLFELTYREQPVQVHTLDPAAVPDAAKTVDWYPSGVADPAANVFDRCLDVGMLSSSRPVSDVVPWTLGAVVGADTTAGLAVLRGPAGTTAYCRLDHYRATQVDGPMGGIGSPADAYQVRALAGRDSGPPLGFVLLVGGTLREDVHRLELVDASGPRPVEVRDRTFAGVLTALPSLDASAVGARLTAYAQDGTVLQTGPVG